jgi:hypothetical protein
MKRAIPITTLFLDIGGVLLTIGWDHRARKCSGLTLRQIGEALGSLKYKTVGKAVQRFEASLSDDWQKRRAAGSSLRKLSIVET